MDHMEIRVSVENGCNLQKEGLALDYVHTDVCEHLWL